MTVENKSVTLVEAIHTGQHENGYQGCCTRWSHNGRCSGEDVAQWLNLMGPDEEPYASGKIIRDGKLLTNGDVRRNWLRNGENSHIKVKEDRWKGKFVVPFINERYAAFLLGDLGDKFAQSKLVRFGRGEPYDIKGRPHFEVEAETELPVSKWEEVRLLSESIKAYCDAYAQAWRAALG